MPPPPPGRPRDPEIDRRIVDATRRLLHAGGLDAVTISAVAAEAEVTRPAVYRRYRDSASLAMAVLLDDLDRVAVAGAPTVPRDLPLADQLIALVRPILAYYAANPTVSTALLQLAVFADTEVGTELNLQLFSFLEDVAARIVEAMQRGELRADTDVQALVGAFFALYFITALGIVRSRLESEEALVATFEAMIRQHLDGVRPSPGAGS
ncbi:MAG: TetR/AcrR family transcriptional regulator [Alphaproteobacteria bacterium]|nr:TetR/AcrR family transcriptional regulator [Alphaproteobacteria bacterium]